jgi:FtsZ-interacting cell division protein ZipA
MKLPVSFDAPSTFDLLLDTASRLSTLLDGELFSDPHTPLDPFNVVAMRKRVGGYDDV